MNHTCDSGVQFFFFSFFYSSFAENSMFGRIDFFSPLIIYWSASVCLFKLNANRGIPKRQKLKYQSKKKKKNLKEMRKLWPQQTYNDSSEGNKNNTTHKNSARWKVQEQKKIAFHHKLFNLLFNASFFFSFKILFLIIQFK